MNRTRLVLAAAVLALAVAAVPALGATPKLTGTDGPGFTITLKKGSTKVTKVKAGKYTITVNDLETGASVEDLRTVVAFPDPATNPKCN